MNPDYQKGKQRKPNPVKRKDLINKTALTKKTYTAGTESNAESENKKRLSSEINYDVLDKLFDDAENSPKRSRLQKPIVLDDQMENSQLSNEKRYLKPQCSEEEEEPDWNEDHSNEDAYGGDEEFEDQNEEDNEGIIW